MTNPMIRIHNISTDTITDREMTAEEFAQYEISQAETAARVAAKAAEAIAKAALLTQLGITEEQAKLLLS
jgi:hypothetical protein